MERSMGLYKGTETAVKQMAAKYAEDMALKLAKVIFDGSVAAQYIHTPKQEVVDMGKTTVHIMAQPELLMSALKLGSHVVPPRSVAGVTRITTTRGTDVIAVLKEVSTERR